MKFYDETKLLYIETDVSGVGLGVVLLQTRSNTSCPRDEAPDNSILRPIAFSSKSLTGAETRYSNIKEKHWVYYMVLKKIHHYCFAGGVSIIMDYKLLVAIFKKDVSSLAQRFQ